MGTRVSERKKPDPATTLTLDSGGYKVIFQGTDGNDPSSDYGNGNRFATVDGHLTLTGVTVEQFSVGSMTTDGTPGAKGADGLPSSCPNCPDGNGTATGSPGGNGGQGGDGPSAHGGALLIDGDGVVTLNDATFTSDFAEGGHGGAGGDGGLGGLTQPVTPSGTTDTNPGGAGGNGGNGGNGGDAYGGAIENNGSLTINNSSFTGDVAQGGTSVGGSGGAGGEGGGAPGAGGAGGNGGSAGHTGSAYGGAIYNTGTLTISGTVFDNDYAGYTGTSFGGSGGAGGSGRSVNPGGSPGNGGAGGDGAPFGTVGVYIGGDVYSADAFTVTGGSAAGIADAQASQGGDGGLGGDGGQTYDASTGNPGPPDGQFGTNGSPSPSVNPPVAYGQASGNTFVPTPNSGSVSGTTTTTSPGTTTTTSPGTTTTTSPGTTTTTNSGTGSGSGSGTSDASSNGTSGASNNATSGASNNATSGASNNAGSNSGSTSGAGQRATLGAASTSGASASVPVACAASAASCAVSANLSFVEVVSEGKVVAVTARAKVRRTVVLGRATATILAGHTGVLRVKLSASGQRLLASRHHLSAHLTVLQQIAGKQVVLRVLSVHFSARR